MNCLKRFQKIWRAITELCFKKTDILYGGLY